jgi:hypothetical protein
MNRDKIDAARISQMAGISRNRARSNIRNGALRQSSHNMVVVDSREAEKFVARQRFAQRIEKRHVKQREQIADSLRPRVTVGIGGAK